ncbi:GntR family transcriptional regulator [Cytobacillus oceanisediminis]|uniref:GntR family transcriptional regulator n=1 Tax=Cytobacillus oceanisediminis TaxID=665099 RepID=UPI0023DA774D|nr:GntR family transcriptional regulator [Cytobacillus oceanisediminis]MDF2039813.1 GntR family transcriptional regulator [Cytobacillus oceanisediminis]
MKDTNLIDHSSLSRLIAEKIAEDIITGRLKSGDKLIEANYAEEFGTSRAPIREAFYLLAIDGLVDRIPRKGSIIRGYSEKDIIDLIEIRMTLEALAMDRIAINGISETLIKVMEELVLKMESIQENTIEYTNLNQEFHLGIIDMSKSEIIRMMYLRLGLPLLSLQRVSFGGEGSIKQSLKEHIVILDNLKRHNFDEAKMVLMKHNQNVLKHFPLKQTETK